MNSISIIGIYSRYHRDLNLVCMLVASFIWQASNHLKSLRIYEWFKLRGGVIGAWVGLGADGGYGLGKTTYCNLSRYLKVHFACLHKMRCFEILYHIR